MKNKTFHTAINLLVEPIMYQQLRTFAKLGKTTMSKLVRDGIRLKLDEVAKKNTLFNTDKYKECSDDQEQNTEADDKTDTTKPGNNQIS